MLVLKTEHCGEKMEVTLEWITDKKTGNEELWMFSRCKKCDYLENWPLYY